MTHGHFLPKEIDDMPLCPVRADMGICALTTSKLADPIRLTQVGLLRLLGDPSDELTLAVAHARAGDLSHLGDRADEYRDALVWVDALDHWYARFERTLGKHGRRQRQAQADYLRQQMQHASAVWTLAQAALATLPVSAQPYALDLLERSEAPLHLGLRHLLVQALAGVAPRPADRALCSLVGLNAEMDGDELGAYQWFVTLGRKAAHLPAEFRVSQRELTAKWQSLLQSDDE